MRPTIGVIGAGKVGETLARLLSQRGYHIAALYSRSPTRGAMLSERVGAVSVARREEVIAASDLTLLTVPDDAIKLVADSLGIVNGVGKAVVHTSGAHDSGVLAAIAARGTWVGSLHPAYPFSDVDRAVAGLPGAAFAVEANDSVLREWLIDIVDALDGYALEIAPGTKALYHAAMVIASNYAVTLYAIAERLLLDIGAERTAVDAALNALLAGTLENLRAKSIPDALTGPLVRTDVGTIKAHLDALRYTSARGDKSDPRLGYLYKLLARMSYPMLEARGVPTDALESLFEEKDADHETDGT